MQKTYTFHIHGMHCQACVVLTESELKEDSRVVSAKSNLASRTVEVSGDFGEMAPADIAKELSTLLSEHSLDVVREKKEILWKEFQIAVPIALGFVFLFVLLQKIGIVNLVDATSVSYGTAFVVGIIASLSTCMAVVGGLLLSMSATFAKDGETVRPQALFHISRLVAFFVLGGVIGAIGSVFQLGSVGTFVIGLIIGLVMLILGLNLLDIFHWTKRLTPSMPKFLAAKSLSLAKLNHMLMPVLVGVLTFFLPCGFTQSMQIYTLSTGTFWEGGLTMLAFALGTLPVLAFLSFSSFRIQGSPKAGIFFKSAGLIVILFALYNLINSLVAIGWIAPVFNL